MDRGNRRPARVRPAGLADGGRLRRRDLRFASLSRLARDVRRRRSHASVAGSAPTAVVALAVVPPVPRRSTGLKAERGPVHSIMMSPTDDDGGWVR